MTAATFSEARPTTRKRIPAKRNWTIVAAGLLSAIYLITSILIARHRLFWYDEILTVIYSVKPTISAMWQSFIRGADGSAPANDLIVRLFAHLSFPLEVSARLPSALAVAAGLLVTFDCARRLADGIYGLIAVAFLTCSTLPYYGYEARPYALFFLFSAVALWLWMNTGDSTTSAFLLGGIFFLAVWVHYYTVLWLAPYTLWEFLNRDSRPVPSRKLIAAYAGVFCGLASLLRPILAQHRALACGFWSPASIRNLVFTFTDLFPHVLFPLVALIGIAALWAPKQKKSLVPPMQPYEQLCWLFASLPIVGFVVGKLATHAFLSRYFIGLLPAFAIGLACLMWRHFAASKLTAVVAFALFAAFGLAQQLEHVRYSSSVRPIPPTLELDRMHAMLALEEQLPARHVIVLRPGDLLSLEAHYYARHPERIVFLLGPGESAPDPHAPLSTGENRPIRHWTVEELRGNARDAILIDPTPQTLDDLHRSGHPTTEHYDGILDVVEVQ